VNAKQWQLLRSEASVLLLRNNKMERILTLIVSYYLGFNR